MENTDKAARNCTGNISSVEIEIGEELGRFESLSDWVNNAKHVYERAYEKIGSRDIITLDSAIPRRIMLRGLQFNNAHEDCTFPAVIYAISNT